MKRFWCIKILISLLYCFSLSSSAVFALNQSDQTTLQSPSATSFLNFDTTFFQNNLTYLQDKSQGNSFTIDDIKKVAVLKESVMQYQGGVDGTTPMEQTIYTVTGYVSGSGFVSTVSEFIQYYQNTSIPFAIKAKQSETDINIAELAAIQHFTNFLVAKTKSGSLTEKIAASLLIRRISPHETDLRGQLALSSTNTAGVDIMSGADVTGATAVNKTNAGLDNATAQQKLTDSSKESVGKCTLWSWSVIGCLDEGFAWLIKNTLLQIAGFLVWLTANMLNYTIQIGILQFSTLAQTGDIYAIWMVIRQIISLFVVFSGLYLGFMYIIGKGDDFKKYVPWVLIFGLFVNFSYPLVRTLIDISNVISLNAYSAAMGSDVLANGGANSPGSMIATRLGLAGLLAGATAVDATAGGLGSLTKLNSVPAALLAVVFVAYAAWVFFVATGIIIARTVVLIFMIIASPLLFVDSVVPKLGEKAMEMRKLFFGQLMVAPVFMILLSVTIKFLDIFNKTAGGLGGNAVGAIGGGNGSAQTFVSLLLMIGALKVMITVTKDLSGKFGDFATNTLGTVGGFALGAASGGAGMLARGTIGRKALQARDSGWVKNNQHTFVGRQAYNLTNSLSSSTFDARNNTFIKSKTDKLGLGMGMGSKLGFEQSKATREKTRAEHVGNIQSRIQTRFTKDTVGKDGILHKAGDIDREGMTALANLRKDENSLTNKAIRKVTGTDAPDEVFQKANEKMTAEDKKMVEEQKSELVTNYEKNPETGKKNSDTDKANILASLKKDAADAQKADPGLANIRTQALVSAVKNIENKKKEDDTDFEKKVKNSLEVYKTLAQEKQATFLAQQDEEVREAIKIELSGGRSNVSTSRNIGVQSQTLAQTPTQTPRAPLNANQADSQAFVNESTVPAYLRRGMNNPAQPQNNPVSPNQTSAQAPASVTTPVAPLQQTANLNNNMAQALGGSRPQVTTTQGFKQFNFAQHAAQTPQARPQAPSATTVRPLTSVSGSPLVTGAASSTPAANTPNVTPQAAPSTQGALPKAA